MAWSSKYDDPNNINKFLQMMNGKPSAATEHSEPQVAELNLNPERPAFSPQVPTIENKPEPAAWENTPAQSKVQSSEQWNPAPGRQTSSPSPFPQATTTHNTSRIDLIQNENGFVTEAPITCAAVEEQVLTPKNPNTGRAPYQVKNLTPTQHRLLMGKKPGIEKLTEQKLAELRQQTHGYMDNVVENFRKSRQPMFPQGQVTDTGRGSQGIKQETDSESSGSIPFPDIDETPIKPGVRQSNRMDFGEGALKRKDWQDEKLNVVPFNTPVADSADHHGAKHEEALAAFPTLDETPIIKSFSNVKLSDDLQAPTTPTDMTVVKDEPAPPPAVALGKEDTLKDQNSIDEGVMVENKTNASGVAFGYSHSPTIVVTASTETEDSVKEDDEEEDRENLTRFKEWGPPTARNKPRSRPRTVILSGLPHTADFTLVQSLIHGGAIECMRLIARSPERTTASAHVTFTSSDACDRYYDNYPNGLDVRHQGKKWPVLVHKRDQVDVISGMLQGYLECGATRVVKVNNADDDWGIIALNKLAEGRNGTRQVEAVHDTYHNGTRTITFRFANITHAVQFKGILIRSDDWDGCHVEFVQDPCEKATSVHNE